MEIPKELVYAVVAGYALQIGIQLVSYGELRQKVSNLQKETAEIKKQISNGFTCKFHAEFAEKVGRIEGKLQTRREQ